MNRDSTPTPVPSPDVTLWHHVAVAWLVSIGLTFLATREGRLLSFDGYHYVEFAKQFGSVWPDRFGNHWPFGWPLAGGLLGRLGLPAWWALVGLGSLAMGLLIGYAAIALRGNPDRAVWLVALGAAPIMAPQLAGCLTELPFAAALMGLVICLARWPARQALWGAAVCAVLALTIRYAGIITLPVIAVMGLAYWQKLRAASRLGEAIISSCTAALMTALLLGINIYKSGHASGAGRGNPAGLASLPYELTSFGWSAPSALLAGGLRDRVGPDTAVGLLLGGMCFAAITALCAWSWFSPRSACSRPLALVAFGYSFGMCVLHCIGDFDALYNARTFLPAFAPLAILAAERLAVHRRLAWAFSAFMIAAGVTAAARGISRETGGDVRPAVAILRARVGAGERIGINDHAFSISAYLAQPTERLWPQTWVDHPRRPHLVISGKPQHRDGSGAIVPKDWAELAEGLVSAGRYRYLVREPGLIALERSTPSPSAP